MSNRILIDDTFRDGRWLQRCKIGDKYTWTVSGVLWNNIKERCKANSATQLREKTYINSVNNFKSFDHFVAWNKSQIGYAKGYDLDSDILKRNSTKVYSDASCLLIPPSLNRFLQSVQKGKTGFRGVSINQNKLIVRCQIDCDKGGKPIILLSGTFLLDEIELAKKAYSDARTRAGNIWYNRLLTGDYEVDPRVVSYMKDWRFTHD